MYEAVKLFKSIEDIKPFIKEDFKTNFDITGFDEFLRDVSLVQENDFDTANTLYRECSMWFDYMSQTNILLQSFIDKYQQIEDIYTGIRTEIKISGEIPRKILLNIKIKNDTDYNMLMEFEEKDDAVKNKLKLARKAHGNLSSYISYLNYTNRKLYLIMKKFEGKFIRSEYL